MTGDLTRTFEAADGSKFEVSIDMLTGRIDLSQSDGGIADRMTIDPRDLDEMLDAIRHLRLVREFANQGAAA